MAHDRCLACGAELHGAPRCPNCTRPTPMLMLDLQSSAACPRPRPQVVEREGRRHIGCSSTLAVVIVVRSSSVWRGRAPTALATRSPRPTQPRRRRLHRRPHRRRLAPTTIRGHDEACLVDVTTEPTPFDATTPTSTDGRRGLR